MKTWPETMCSDDWRPALTTPIRLDGELIFTDGRLLGWHGLLMPVRPLDPINPIAAEVRPLEPIGRKVIPA